MNMGVMIEMHTEHKHKQKHL